MNAARDLGAPSPNTERSTSSLVERRKHALLEATGGL